MPEGWTVAGQMAFRSSTEWSTGCQKTSTEVLPKKRTRGPLHADQTFAKVEFVPPKFPRSKPFNRLAVSETRTSQRNAPCSKNAEFITHARKGQCSAHSSCVAAVDQYGSSLPVPRVKGVARRHAGQHQHNGSSLSSRLCDKAWLADRDAVLSTDANGKGVEYMCQLPRRNCTGRRVGTSWGEDLRITIA